MKIVIIEDEQLAARRLENMIKVYDPEIEVVAKLESVSESVDWFNSNPMPDLILQDIHLEDTISFAIFSKVKISCPVIFTTATDPASTQAFAREKIDCLLKPIIQKELVAMIEKYRNIPAPAFKHMDASLFKDIMNTSKSSPYESRNN